MSRFLVGLPKIGQPDRFAVHCEPYLRYASASPAEFFFGSNREIIEQKNNYNYFI